MTRKNWISLFECEKFKDALLKEENCYFVNVGEKWRLVSQKEAEQINDITPLANYLDSYIVHYDLYKEGHQKANIHRFLTKILAQAIRAHKAVLESNLERDPREIVM